MQLVSLFSLHPDCTAQPLGCSKGIEQVSHYVNPPRIGVKQLNSCGLTEARVNKSNQSNKRLIPDRVPREVSAGGRRSVEGKSGMSESCPTKENKNKNDYPKFRR